MKALGGGSKPQLTKPKAREAADGGREGRKEEQGGAGQGRRKREEEGEMRREEEKEGGRRGGERKREEERGRKKEEEKGEGCTSALKVVTVTSDQKERMAWFSAVLFQGLNHSKK